MSKKSETSPDQVPTHIAIIMDGNGRWAISRGLPRLAGHRAGTENLRRVIEACVEFGVKYLTLYAFSTENWVRSKEEIDVIFGYMIKFLKNYKTELIKENGNTPFEKITSGKGVIDDGLGVVLLSATEHEDNGNYKVEVPVQLILKPKDTYAGTYTTTISIELIEGPGPN